MTADFTLYLDGPTILLRPEHTRLRESILSKMLPNMRNGWSNFPATTAQASSL